MECNN